MASSLDKKTVTIVFNVFKSEANLPNLLEKVDQFAKEMKQKFHLSIVFVIDGSPDNSEAYLRKELKKQFHFKPHLEILSKNYGGPNALRCGLTCAQGDYFASMACDLQEPLNFISEAFDVLESGDFDIVYGQRIARHDSIGTKVFSSLFWSFYRFSLEKSIPKGGADLFLCNRIFKDAIIKLPEINHFLIGLMFWMGFRKSFLPYSRSKRTQGKSSWSISKRIQYMMDSIFSFSDIPIKAISLTGIIGVLTSSILGMILIVAKMLNVYSVPGYTAIMLAICFFCALNCFALGIIGEYIWRIFINVQKRPHFIVRDSISFSESDSYALKDSERRYDLISDSSKGLLQDVRTPQSISSQHIPI